MKTINAKDNSQYDYVVDFILKSILGVGAERSSLIDPNSIPMPIIEGSIKAELGMLKEVERSGASSAATIIHFDPAITQCIFSNI